jgi:hypothetical protein
MTFEVVQADNKVSIFKLRLAKKRWEFFCALDHKKIKV